ncbi:alanine racemase [Rufibacter glacialis]|uniref:Alanine racemase n=1 Tax=Rufibacter glacialis TaxID=1259555 RepID=A0A5M8QDL2_9BACT|nr:alanine racemase [Rufibacter glacialis]KAA6433268.1 alanine racemase [Rufibacter glacialis]GGK75993.1 alanine racemase [Rufibacter glacialis]
MSFLDQISEPTLLLNEAIARANIGRMAEKAKRHKVRLRPHFKTHQSRQAGEWFREEGITAITVSSVKMAQYFARHGWQDITVAFPLNRRQLPQITELAQQITLHLTVTSADDVAFLREHLAAPVHLWVKADTGYGRTGIKTEDTVVLEAVLAELKQTPQHTFSGFLAHAGHSYKARSHESIAAIHQETLTKMRGLKERYSSTWPKLQLSIGDTPSCSTMEDFSGIDEIRPGNFVFYDLTQNLISSCRLEDIAVALACPVVALHPDRHEVILYGGAVHFSKDALQQPDGAVIFGLVVPLTESGWGEPLPETALVSLSQEHGIVRTTPELFSQFEIGGLMGVLPVHSCLTADLMKGYVTLEGKQLEHLSGVTQRHS